MATINVRGLDAEVVRRIERRAAANNRSLESEARAILELALRDDDMETRRKEFIQISDCLRELTRGAYQPPSEVFIREDRERGHRDFV